MDFNKLSNSKESKAPEFHFKFGLVVTSLGVTRHDINEQGELLGGEWLDDDEILKSVNMISEVSEVNKHVADDFTLLPENLLLDNHKFIAWYKPSCQHTIFIGEDGYFNLPHPALIFAATKNGNRLFVMALKSNKRPTLACEVFNAPLPNFYKDNHICNGSAPFPAFVSPTVIPELEAILFESRYTAFKYASFKVKGDTTQYEALKSLQGKSRFPQSLLAPDCSGAIKTVADFFNSVY